MDFNKNRIIKESPKYIRIWSLLNSRIEILNQLNGKVDMEY
jgi:hypothetical protein